jgi:hypothetical protein
MTEDQHIMLYGATSADDELSMRMLHDLIGTLATVLNLYGGMCRPPLMLLSWPKKEIEPVYPLLESAERKLTEARKLETRHGDTYYRLIASALGYYQEAMKAAYMLATKCKHEPLITYTRAARRYIKADPAQFSAAADGAPSELEKTLRRVCRQTRKRFGDQLREHAVTFDPPAVAEQYVYTTGGMPS